LSDVHPIGAHRFDQIGPIVEDEQRAVLRYRVGEPLPHPDDPGIRGVLHPQLDHVHTGAQDRAQELVGLLVADEVQAGGGQSFASVRHPSECGRSAATGRRVHPATPR